MTGNVKNRASGLTSRRAVVLAAAALPAMAASAARAEPDGAKAIDPRKLHGTWRLTGSSAIDGQGNALPAPYGPSPMGRLILSPEGRMLAMVSDGRLTLPEGEKRAYASYCGNYTIEDNVLKTMVDAAFSAELIGTEQIRRLELRAGQLILKPLPREDGQRRELIWDFAGPA